MTPTMIAIIVLCVTIVCIFHLIMQQPLSDYVIAFVCFYLFVRLIIVVILYISTLILSY